MQKAVLLLIITLVALFLYGGVLTRNGTIPLSKEFFSTETAPSAERPLDLQNLTVFRTLAGGQDLSDQTLKELEKLHQLQLDKGIRNLPVVSHLLVTEARRAREAGRLDDALRLANVAVKFSPQLPLPYFELARIHWKRSPFQFEKIVPEMLRGQAAHFRNFRSALRFFYNSFYILVNALLIAFMIFGIVVIARYLPLYLYDIRRTLSEEVLVLLLNSAKILVLVLPVFFRFDILWAILYWCILLWGYVSKRERAYLIVFLLVLVYFPFFLRTSSSFLESPSSDILSDLYQANDEEWDRSLEQRLETWLTAHPDDGEVLFTLGLIKKREGRQPQAEELYRKAFQRDPQLSEALCNLGNVYLNQKQTRSAITAYQQAIQIHPDRGAYYYNLYRAYSQETLLSSEINKAFERARQLDPKLVDQYSTAEAMSMNRYVIDEVLTPGRLWKRYMTQYIGREGLLFRLFKAWFERIPSRIPIMAPILFLGFMMGMSRYCRTKKFLTRCPMCGSPTHRFYHGSSEQEFICFNCYRIFVQREKLYPTIADRKSIQVQQYQKQNQFVSKFLSVFLAGFGDLWQGYPFKGLLLLLIFFLFILRFVYWDGILPSFFAQPPSSLWRWVIWGGLFLLFYVLTLRRALRFKPGFKAVRRPAQRLSSQDTVEE